MSSKQKISIFFISISIICFNPLWFFIMYGDANVYNSRILSIVYTVVPLSFLGLIFLIRKNKLIKIHNLLFGLSFSVIFFSSLVLLNSFTGIFINKQSEKNLIFPANSSANYKTIEFNWTSNINSIGLRNPEINIEKNDKYRILCFGDSWTYGWGEDEQYSWPRQLNKYLISNGFENYEVINCGRGGAYSKMYLNYMNKCIPLLNPDLVIVGILQLDDLAQLINHKIYKPSNTTNKYQKLKSLSFDFFEASFKNFISLASKTNRNQVNISNHWEKESNIFIEQLSEYENTVFTTLPDTIQKLFKTGNLNPGLLKVYLNFDDFISFNNNLTNPKTKYAIDEMKNDVREMKKICDKNKTELIIANMPISFFTGHKVVRTNRRNFIKRNNIDSIYKTIAKENNLGYIELTKEFEKLENKEIYFYKFDGHPTKIGYKKIAEEIGKNLIINKFK